MCVKIILGVILIFFLINFIINRRDNFATKQEKAETIYGWFANNEKPTYTKYKADLPDANIVEYEDTLKLKQKNKLNLENILSNI